MGQGKPPWLQGELIVPRLEGGFSAAHRCMMWGHRTGENELSVNSRVCLRIVACTGHFLYTSFSLSLRRNPFL
jgi:hypothetical protein